ncbi:MAG: hypothetical protein J6565_08305, partial [Lactobacillus sp.]|nr:hypothetical protein [Lactobacillus sp.]
MKQRNVLIKNGTIKIEKASSLKYFKKACNINNYKLFLLLSHGKRTAKKMALIHPYCRCTTVPYIEGLP